MPTRSPSDAYPLAYRCLSVSLWMVLAGLASGSTTMLVVWDSSAGSLVLLSQLLPYIVLACGL